MVRLPLFAVLFPIKWAVMLAVLVCAFLLSVVEWATEKVDQ